VRMANKRRTALPATLPLSQGSIQEIGTRHIDQGNTTRTKTAKRGESVYNRVASIILNFSCSRRAAPRTRIPSPHKAPTSIACGARSSSIQMQHLLRNQQREEWDGSTLAYMEDFTRDAASDDEASLLIVYGVRFQSICKLG
jgi:hypothetical protein